MERLIKSLEKKLYKEIDGLTNLLEVLPDSKTISVQFSPENGGGFKRDSTLSDYLGIKRNEFTFRIERDGDGKITNMDELQKVANTIALYVKAHPDAVAKVLIEPEKGKSYEVYFAYSNKGLLPNSYILCSSYTKKNRFHSKDLMENDELYKMYSNGFYEAHADDFKTFLIEHKLAEDIEPTDLSDDLRNEFIQRQLRKGYEEAWNVLGGILETKITFFGEEVIAKARWVKPGLYDFTDIWNFALCSFEDEAGNYHVCSGIMDDDHKGQAWLHFQNNVFPEILLKYYGKKYENNKQVTVDDIESMATFIDLTKE